MLAVYFQGSSAPLLVSAYSSPTTIHTLSALSTVIARNITSMSPQKTSQQRRSFWWGRGCSSYMSPAARHIEARQRVYRYRIKDLQRAKSHWNLKDGGFENEIEALRQHSKRTAERLRRIQDIKRHIEADPYGALFGSRSMVLGGRPFLRAWTRSIFNIDQPSKSTQVESKTEHSSSPTSKPPTDSEYEIDPITLRKVPKTQQEATKSNSQSISSPSQSLEGQSKDKDAASDSYESLKKALDARKQAYRSAQPSPTLKTHDWNWLQQEGFSSVPNSPVADKSGSKGSVASISETPRSNLEKAYDSIDMKAEDLDLLRSSDVKAGAGITRSKPNKNVQEKGEQQRKLAEDFETPNPAQSEEVLARDAVEKYQQGKLAPRVEAQPPKTEADHLISSKERERDLVRAIRSIYEDSYGTISTQHRQTPPTPPTTPPPAYSPPTQSVLQSSTYQILAFDPSTQTVVSAESIVPSPPSSEAQQAQKDAESPLSVPQVLLTLTHPAKFLPLFAPLQKRGYELVKASGDVVVFKLMPREGKPQPTVAEVLAAPNKADISEPVIKAIAEESPLKETQPQSQDPVKTQAVRREEPVFSGRSRWAHRRHRHHLNHLYGFRRARGGRVRRFIRRTFWAALWVAACTYAAGVVIEFFRTGGSDGRGAVGF